MNSGGDTPPLAARKPIDVVRDLHRSWETRPFEPTREALLAANDWDDAVRRYEEAGLPVDPIDPDVEVVMDALPDGAGLIGQTGRDGWVRFWQLWVEPWKDFTLEVLDTEQIGDYVISEAHATARTRAGDGELDITTFQLFKVREGLIVMFGVYSNRDDALAAIRAE